LPWLYWEFNYDSIDEEFMKFTALLKYRTKILNTAEIQARDHPQTYSDMLRDYTVINSVGVESLCQQALKAVGRPPISRNKFNVFIQSANRYNIAFKIDLILGLPFETLTSYFDGLESILSYFKGTDHILNIHQLQILPGCELEGLCQEYGIIYMHSASHFILSTPDFSEKEINFAAKLSALLSRILNSPLRGRFFEAKERSGGDLIRLLKNILDGIIAAGQFGKTRLLADDSVDEFYWNYDIYREIPSKWLMDFLESYKPEKG
jgi:hypothetical protein